MSKKKSPEELFRSKVREFLNENNDIYDGLRKKGKRLFSEGFFIEADEDHGYLMESRDLLQESSNKDDQDQKKKKPQKKKRDYNDKSPVGASLDPKYQSYDDDLYDEDGIDDPWEELMKKEGDDNFDRGWVGSNEPVDREIKTLIHKVKSSPNIDWTPEKVAKLVKNRYAPDAHPQQRAITKAVIRGSLGGTKSAQMMGRMANRKGMPRVGEGPSEEDMKSAEAEEMELGKEWDELMADLEAGTNMTQKYGTSQGESDGAKKDKSWEYEDLYESIAKALKVLINQQ